MLISGHFYQSVAFSPFLVLVPFENLEACELRMKKNLKRRNRLIDEYISFWTFINVKSSLCPVSLQLLITLMLVLIIIYFFGREKYCAYKPLNFIANFFSISNQKYGSQS